MVSKQILQERQKKDQKIFFSIAFFSYFKRLLLNFNENSEKTHHFNGIMCYLFFAFVKLGIICCSLHSILH